MTELARCPNVVMKLGGMMMRLAACDYRTLPAPPTSAELAALWRPYIETCIELFGPTAACSRAISPWTRWGSAGRPLWNALKLTAAGASAEEKLAMFSGTARRVYRLD